MNNSKNTVPPTWTTGSTEIFETGTWRSTKPIYQQGISPCSHACPLNGSIASWTRDIFKGELKSAWFKIVNLNPFPAICGRICHHPCESTCNREAYDGAVTVNALEQFVGDKALEESWSLPTLTEEHDQKIAVIGGGPAGLSCAYHLRRQGYRVAIFEAQSELGGVLRYGIPDYRLSKSIVQAEIHRLLSLGFEIHTNSFVSAAQLADMKKEYAAIFLAVGAPVSKTLPQLPVDDVKILDALSLLKWFNLGEAPVLGNQVVVIGGGSVAMDAARTARRLGSQVKVMSLEARTGLPAQPGEVLAAEDEGVVLLPGATVLGVKRTGSELTLDCAEASLGLDRDNNITPVVGPGTDFILLADTVILAVGQQTDLREIAPLISVENSLILVQDDQAASVPGVYAGGDAASNARYVSEAIAAGMRAASSIADYLLGEERVKVLGGEDQVGFGEINTFYFPFEARGERELVEALVRLKNFNEERQGLSEQQALNQAKRCFNCGYCLQCDNCYYFCPDTAVVKNDSPDPPYYIADQYCKGCGLCVEECPRGAIRLKEEEGR